MKNKSTRHKSDNTFKFQPFSERISNIDIDVFHKVKHECEIQTEEAECYFYQAIQKWSTLNLTEIYNQFNKEIKPNNYITLPQLLLDKDRVIEVLLKYLKLRNSLCLQPLLEIVVAVAQDLQKEFYPYYSEFLDVLIELLNTKESEHLEWIFTCLAYMFKFLWRPFIKNINNVFNSLLPLLSDDKPDYINSFAAESFAFVARKVKDKEAFLELLVNAVEKRKDGVPGCGKLLFEVIKGVNGQFHSCAEQFLPFILRSLWSNRYTQAVLFEIIEQIIVNIATTIHKQKNSLIWEVLLKTLSDLKEECNIKKSDEIEHNIALTLKLLGQLIEYKEGKLLQEPRELIQQLVKLLDFEDLQESVLLIVIQMAVSILLSPNIRLPQEQASHIIRKILTLNNKNLLLYFVDNVNKCSSFEILILPSFLRKCGFYQFDHCCIKVLTKLLLKKAPLCFSGINQSKWNRYTLDFKEYSEEMFNRISCNVSIETYGDLENRWSEYFCALVCFPHIMMKQEKRDIIVDKLEKNLILILEEMENIDDAIKVRKLLFILNILLETIVHAKGKVLLKNCFERIFTVLLGYTSDINYLMSLKSLSFLLTALKDDEEIITTDTLKKIDTKCSINFSSPYHELRHLTAHIYTLFECLPEFKLKYSDDPGSIQDTWKVFSLCYEVESIEPLVQTYREQLQRLEKLNFDKPQMIMCNQTDFKLIPLRYMCGVLYINFQLLWEPVAKIIASYAYGLDSNSFWSVFGSELQLVVENIKNSKEIITNELGTDFDCLEHLYQECQQVKIIPDFVNYRMLLWKAMGFFPSVVESKTRDVSNLVLNFFGNEYTRKSPELAVMCNVKEFSFEDDNTVEGDLNEKEETENNSKSNKTDVQGFGKLGRKVIIKLLLHKLSVFSQFRSPKSVYREQELYRVYFDLLKHKNADIQKAALDCIMTYKFKYLMPYKDHLYNLVNNENYKHELINFRIDKDNTDIQAEHRENLIPIVLQIVFSKMSAKIGLRTGGKASSQNRRNLILRFLAGCQEDEMVIFAQKAFSIYSNYLEDNELNLANNVANAIDLEKCLAPKKLLSSLNLLNVILEQFGGLMGNKILTYLIKILLVIGSLVKGLISQSEKLHAGYFSILRNLRTSSISTLERFFQHFDQYPWTSVQINAIFTTFVWPYLDKLNVEGIHSPTTLFKLFKQWSSNPKYFKLLAKHQENNASQYILPHVFKLLTNDKSNIVVVNAIYEMVENLLKYEISEEESSTELEVDDVLPIEQYVLEKIETNFKLNYGSCILLPHISCILSKIKNKLQGKNRALNRHELFILSRVSELVWESEISDQILHLLLPIALKRCSSDEEVVSQLFVTIHNLVKNVNEPQIHLRNVIPFFGEVSYPSCRKMLIQILEHIAQKSQMENAACLLGDLNAFDAKWIDQPDFERRHSAFKCIQNAISEDKIDLSLGTALIYNCYYFMKSEKDLALKDNSSHTLKCLCPYLIRKYQGKHNDTEYLINDCIFAIIKSGMRTNNNTDLRNECISLLGHLARECPDGHFVLRDLNKFTNKADLEVDFFENLTHMQIYRHSKAMLKFCQIIRDETVAPNPKTITQFLLPLASYYLCSDKFTGKNSVIDAAIEMLGVICRILPWHQYEGILKYSLSKLRYKLEYQKQLVRLVVVILDAFHFDLSKGHLEEIKIVEKKEIVEETHEEELLGQESEHSFDKVEENEIEIENFEESCIDINGDEEEIIAKEQKIIDKIAILSKSTATRVINIIQNVLLPQLHQSLAELTHYDTSHKINRKKTGFEREEEDLARVPISLAVVKLLQRLPKKILDSNLPGIFLKLCTFLKSHLESVRRVTKETLQKIMITLGPKYLKLLLGEMVPLLNRGFQVHVLVFTVHGVLNCLKGTYEPEDIDQVLLTILKLCTTDLFGIASEEKEVVKITARISEAKSMKTYDTLQNLAQHITEKCLMDIILPIKQILETNHSFKTIQRVQEALRHIALGLVDNNFISTESLLKFAYGTSSQSILQLLPVKKKKLTEEDKERQLREKEDCFIIPKIPGNRTQYRELNVKTSSNTNSYLLVEFGLRLCFVMLKREKLKDEEYRPYIDPFVVVFKNCLKSKHVKLCTLTLQCLQWVMKYEVPSMKQHIKQITKDMFSTLHKYASSGLGKGDNFDLVVAAFKTMAVLVRDVHYYTVDTNQLKVLLLYVEQDMHDNERQATAFSLLKAIISRKLIVPEIHSVMSKVAELSIISELNYVRSQARMVFHQFLMEYPLGNSLEKHLGFYISQMSFEMQHGRESAYEMIQMLINSFPLNVLKNHAGTLLITLGARLVNDDVPECRKYVAECIASMLKRLSKTDRNLLFEILTVWLKDKEISHRRLAAQVCGIFVTVEKDEFEARLSTVVPLILKQFGLTDETPGKFVKLKPEKNTPEQYQRLKDHHYFQVLQLILKICAECPAFLQQKKYVEHLAYHTQTLLAYPHDWVRLAAAQFLGFVLSSIDINRLSMLLLENKSEDGYLCTDPENYIKSLTLDLCDQLQPGDIKNELAEQVIKNLVFIARVLQKIPNNLTKRINLLWLAKRIRKIIYSEITENPNNTVLRTEIFKWIAGVGTALEIDNIMPILHHLLAPLVREMITTEEENAPLRQLAKEVANYLKNRVGVEVYTKTLQTLQQNLTVKRAERKRSRKQLAVTDPQAYAQKKIKRHEKKKVSKKRKIEQIRGKKSFKRRKLVDLEDNSEIM